MRHRACSRAEIPPGGMARVEVNGTAVLIADVEGELFAIADSCSHAEASLSEGDLDGYEISCPMHGAYFDVRTGEPLSPPAVEPVETYRVSIEDGVVFVELPDRVSRNGRTA